jgi:hypothetical protein
MTMSEVANRFVTKEEARLAAQRLINSHFNNPDRARMQIPVSPNDDVTVMAFIEQVSDLRALESEFAYERAVGMIESSCLTVEEEDLNAWYDLDTGEVCLEDEVTYLDSRRLLLHHSEHPNWVKICDEGEPLPQVKA